jgi:hypothetical protein
MIIKMLLPQRCETSVLNRFARGPDSIERILAAEWPTKSIHCHAIVVVTANPQCRIRFRQISKGFLESVALVWIQLHRDDLLLVPVRFL